MKMRNNHVVIYPRGSLLQYICCLNTAGSEHCTSKFRAFPVRLENPHVISSDQVWVGVVSTGPSGCALNSSYQNRDTLTYKQELGNAIGLFHHPLATLCQQFAYSIS